MTNRMKKILLYMLTFVLATTASAPVRVTVWVIDLQNKPVSDVIVKMVCGSKAGEIPSQNTCEAQIVCGKDNKTLQFSVCKVNA